jgi:DNA polymerase eta
LNPAYDTTRSKQAPFPFTRAANIDFICKAADRLWVELVGTNAEYDKNKGKGRATAMKITNVFLGFAGVETMAAGQRSIEGFFSDSDRHKRKAEDGVHAEGSDKRRALGTSVGDGPAEPEVGTSLSYRCSRCDQQIRRATDEVDDREAALDILKMEHDDFHYAQDLAKAGDGNTNPNEKKRKKGKVVPTGIAKFFPPVAPKRKN